MCESFLSDELIDKLAAMSDSKIIEYSESYLGFEGRELALELSKRLRKKNSENYSLISEIQDRDGD